MAIAAATVFTSPSIPYEKNKHKLLIVEVPPAKGKSRIAMAMALGFEKKYKR